MPLKKIGLLPRVILAIAAGLFLGQHIDLFLGQYVSTNFVRCCATFNALFGQMLGYSIPLIILGLVAPGIAELGKNGGRLLGITVALAYGSTLFAGCLAYSACSAIFPSLIGAATEVVEKSPEPLELGAIFSIAIPPVMDVMSALVLAFVFGIGMAAIGSETLLRGFTEGRDIVKKLISTVIVPLLPLHIFGLFLGMTYSGTAGTVIAGFGKVIGVIFVLHLLLLLIQFSVAGMVGHRNPLQMLWTMFPAYATALGTSSSAATIPVTLASAKKLGINNEVADFCIPLCATIHLSGSMLKITSMALAVCLMDGLPHDTVLFAGFVALLGVMMVAAPGIPGGAIMAASGVLQSTLGFNEQQIALMIAIYVAIDSFGTAGNVTGDGAIALIVNRIAKKADF